MFSQPTDRAGARGAAPELRAVFLFAALAGLVWGPPLAGGRALFYDTLLRLFHPYSVFLSRCLAAGDFPFWNPHIYAGVPFLGNMQSAVFYPLTSLQALAGFPSGSALSAWAHTVLAAVFCFLCGRERGLGRGGALLAGLAYGFNGFFVMHYAYPSHFHSYPWLPALFLFHERYLRTGALPVLALAALSLALQVLAGHPQFVMYTVLALGIRGLLSRRRGRSLAFLAGAGGLAFLLSAAQLWPSLRLIADSPRAAGQGFEWASAYSLHPRELAVMLAGPLWNLYFVPQSGDPHIVGFYIGWPLLAAAALALTSGRKTAPFLALVLLGGLLSFGRNLPFYRAAYDILAPMRLVRFPAQGLFLACFGIAMLAGAGAGRAAGLIGRRGLLFVLCAADLWLFSRGAVETLDRSVYRQSTPAVGYIQQNAGLSRVFLSPRTRQLRGASGRTVLEAWARVKDTLLPNVPMAFGLYDADGYEELRLRGYDGVLADMGRDPSSGWLDLFGVRYIVSAFDIPGRPLRPALRGDATVYENPRAFPKAYFAAARPEGEDVPSAASAGGVVLEEAAPGVRQETSAVLPPPPVPVLRYGPNRLSLSVRTDRPGWAVATDAYERGWRVWVDGRPERVLRANRFQRAAAVAAGSRRVDWRYRPSGFGGALASTLLSLGALAVLGAARLLWYKRAS